MPRAQSRFFGSKLRSSHARGLGLACGCLAAAFTAPAAAQSASGPLTVHPVNPRYFADAQGRAVYLTGSHTWTNLQDEWTDTFNIVFDFAAYLNFIQAHNHNFIRLWRAEMPQFRYPNDSGFRYSSPHPWIRLGDAPPPQDPAAASTLVVGGSTGGTGGSSGGGSSGSGGGVQSNTPHKPYPPITQISTDLPIADNIPQVGHFDLNTFNQPYFDRLRARCIAARDRGIYVSIMLFEGHALTQSVQGWGFHPFNIANNINGINGDPNNDGHGIESHDLGGPAVMAIQEAYVRKVIDTVNDLDNVLYEIANESHAGSIAWQNHFIDFIHDYEATKPKRHPVIFSTPLANVGAALWQSHAEAIAPFSSGPEGSYVDNPPANNGSKVVFADSDHIFGCAGSASWVWKSFTRGLNVIYMDSYFENSPFCPPPDHNIRKAMGHTLSYARRMNLALTLPRGDLASTGYCLANVGETYLVYLPSGGSCTVNLAGAAGSFAVEWFNVNTGIASSHGAVPAGGVQTMTAPAIGPHVLFLVRTGSIAMESVYDVDKDGAVAASDVGLLLSVLGSACDSPPCAADINRDGIIDEADLLDLLQNWTMR